MNFYKGKEVGLHQLSLSLNFMLRIQNKINKFKSFSFTGTHFLYFVNSVEKLTKLYFQNLCKLEGQLN